jgi:hypothetical protein
LSGCSLTHRTDGDAAEIAGGTAGATSSGGTQQDQTTRKTTRLSERLAAVLCLADLISDFDLKSQISDLKSEIPSLKSPSGNSPKLRRELWRTAAPLSMPPQASLSRVPPANGF